MATFWNRMTRRGRTRVPDQEEMHGVGMSQSTLPMSGISEALWFAPGGDYALSDDTWDPFKEDSGDETDISIGEALEVLEGDEDGDDDDVVLMGQAIPGREAGPHPPKYEEPIKPEFDMAKLEAEIRDIEMIIQKLRGRQSDIEFQLRNATPKQDGPGDGAEDKAKQNVSKLRQDLEQVNRELAKEVQHLDDVMAEGRKAFKAHEEQERRNKEKVRREQDKGKATEEDSGRRTCKRGFIPTPELPKPRAPEKAKAVANFTPDTVAKLKSYPREIGENSSRLVKLQEEQLSLGAQMEQLNKDNKSGKSPSDESRPAVLDDQPKVTTKAKAKEVKAINSKRSKVTSEMDQLKAKVETMERELPQLKQLVQSNRKVQRACKGYKDNRKTFIDKIFTSVMHGKLDDVAVLTAALDIEGEADLIRIDNIVQSQSNLSVLHLALMRDQRGIVEFLLKHSGKDLAKVTVQTEECENMTPLYIAIQHGTPQNVKLVVEAVPEADRAEYINELVPNKAYEGTPYNELPVAASVWSSAGKDLAELNAMLDCLVQNGADMSRTTSNGDTLLHLLVLQAIESIENLPFFRKFLKQAFTKAVGIWWNKKIQSRSGKKGVSQKDAEIRGLKFLLDIKNNEGLTPIALASRVESPLYINLINWENVMRFPDPKMGQQFSNVDTYNITNITSLSRPTGKGFAYNRSSVMHVLAHNDVDLSQKVWNVDISTIEPLKSVIKQKWGVYQWVFYLWGFIHLAYMVAFTTTAFLYKPAIDTGSTDENVQMNNTNESLPVSEELASGYFGPVDPGNPYFAFLLFLPVAYIICEIVDIFGAAERTFDYSYSLTGNALYRIICMVFSIFTIIWFVLHMVRNVNQDIILSMALLFGWIFGIFFTRTINFPSRSSQIGAFSIMVQRMLFQDLTPFLMISFFVLIAFSAAIHATLIHSKEASEENVKFQNTFFDMLKYYAALDDGQNHESSREKEFAKAVLSVYGIISVVLLINMLIAAMNKTYDMVRETHSDLVVRQRLSILLLLERRLPLQCLRQKSEAGFDHHYNRRAKKREVFLKVVSQKAIASLLRKSKKSGKQT